MLAAYSHSLPHRAEPTYEVRKKSCLPQANPPPACDILFDDVTQRARELIAKANINTAPRHKCQVIFRQAGDPLRAVSFPGWVGGPATKVGRRWKWRRVIEGN